MQSARPLSRLILLAGLLPGLACAEAQDIVRTEKGHLGTQVTLSGHGDFLFVLDTAASTSAIYEHTRAALELSADPALRIELQGAGGAQTIERYHLPPLAVAGVEAKGLVVAGLPAGVKHGEEVMGIVGVDVFGEHVVEFDLKANRIDLHDAGHAPASERGWNELPVTLLPPVRFATVEVMVGGQPVTAVLDTGASRSFINWQSARAAGVTPETEGLEKVSTTHGATNHGFDSAKYDFDGVAIGATTFGTARLSISDLSVFAALGLKDKPAMILGLDLLGDRRFVIDYPGQRLLIER